MSLTPSLAVFRHRAYLQYWLMRVFGGAAMQMLAVAIGWQVYDIARLTHPVKEAALILGLVGLAQFLPLFLLSLVGGVAADRLDRKAILVVTYVIRIGVVAWLFLISGLASSAILPSLFVAAATLGGLNAFFPAASSALLPRLVPRDELPQAIAWSSLAFQGAAIAGPAVGGLLYAAPAALRDASAQAGMDALSAASGAQVVYGACILLLAIATLMISLAPTPRHERVEGAHTFTMMIEGLRYVRDNKIVLGAISLDLVVVLFGGAMALLPVFARDILHVGPGGLGLLRAAPAAGAVVVALALATRSLTNDVGRWMLWAVGVFGAATLVIAASTWFWLTLAALAVRGAADMISVYVRQSLIQLATPDAMRGRVSSVSYVFISASNELGEFEAGVAARLLGPIGAVVLGGVVSIGAALGWPRLFPQLAETDRFEDASPEALSARAAGAPAAASTRAAE
jgi:MFS family permease